jgi:hypothetical protein
LLAANGGYTIRIAVTALNSVGSVTATSAQTALVTSLPANTALPTISGTAQAGKTLTATTGTWTGTPAPTYSYQWEQCNSAGEACTYIGGATSSSYTLLAANGGYTIRIAVTALNTVGSVTAASAQTALVTSPPANTALPTISGTAQAGKTLTATNGTWTGYPAPTYTYQWEQCNSIGEACTNISGATSSTYALLAAQAGYTIRIVVTATNSVSAVAAASAQTALVSALPVNTVLPTISGTAQVGKTLTGTNGTWTGTPTPTYTYQWYDCSASCVYIYTIPGATGISHVATTTDIGYYLVLDVTATNLAGSVTVGTNSSPVLPAAPVILTAPVLGNSACQNYPAIVSYGTWSGRVPVPG